ncbi:indole-3-glycerol phosphate synthase [Flavobacteriaceae bacterium MAR_2010_188]|nr:indole-3-glycerol phosphate synthase [Flavobacteriaceae bacterium MAR_2010_188]
MDILEKIVYDKRFEVALKKKLVGTTELEKSLSYDKEIDSLKTRLENSHTGIIAEYKRRSPSKSVINLDQNVWDVAVGYETAGACGMSVLTDSKYFGGSLDDLILATTACKLPILRKEFVIDEYQIIEAKSSGASAILLIAAILEKDEIKTFSELAKSLHLDVLLEVHNEEELQKSLMPSLDMIGVNNRNLKTFEVSLETSKILSERIPSEFLKVSESGISSVEAIKDLKTYGYQGFLIGENFMKTENPGKTAKEFIERI